MDLAFGSGNWDKVNGFDVSQLTAGYSFIYLDGGDGASTNFNSFASSNLAALQSFVSGGGHLMLNAARWDQPDLDLGSGITLAAGFSFNGYITGDGLAAGLAGSGAGSYWWGNYFSHDIATGLSTCYVSSDAGCAFGSKGNLFVGGQTAPYFQSGGALQLRANELTLASSGGSVPEPASWAMMLGGFGLVGGAMRTCRRVAVSFG
ncbi:MAG TPA: PEPxxWA-CTERM sorting domain-containing protein [Sphingomonas sp.]|nr:PEPxxWA-CTERM sorting domain-containing protein [Sphingomonas sp.]